MLSTKDFAISWWTGLLAGATRIEEEKFRAALNAEFDNGREITVLSTEVERPSGHLFNALFNIGVNADAYFRCLPSDLTMWVTPNRVLLLNGKTKSTMTLYANDWNDYNND